MKLIDAETVVGAMDLCITLMQNTMCMENTEVLATLRAYQNIRECVNEWPTIAAEPARKKGRWLIRPRGGTGARCPECGAYFPHPYNEERYDRYCGNCGTEMEGLKVVDDE